MQTISRVWWLSYLFHCLSHSLQPSISEPGCAKASCSFTSAFVASPSLSLSPPCLKIEKRHEAGYCSSSLGCWLLSAPLYACLGLKQQTTVSTESTNTGGKIKAWPWNSNLRQKRMAVSDTPSPLQVQKDEWRLRCVHRVNAYCVEVKEEKEEEKCKDCA